MARASRLVFGTHCARGEGRGQVLLGGWSEVRSTCPPMRLNRSILMSAARGKQTELDS